MNLIELVASLVLDTTNFDEGLDKSQQKAGGIQSALQTAGAVGSGALRVTATAAGIAATALATTGAAVYGLATNAASGADDLLELSTKTGISVENLQKLQYASELVDVPFETMTSSMGKFTGIVGDAAAGNKDLLAIFDQMHISLYDQEGALRPINELWLDAVDGLNVYQNDSEKQIVAQQLFNRSFQDLLPLASAGKQALVDYGNQAQANGAIVSQAAIESAGALDDSIQIIKGTASGVLLNLGSQLAPGVNTFVTLVGGYLGKFGGIVGNTSMTTEEKIQAAGNVISEMANDIASRLPDMANSGIGILKSIITGVVNAIPELMPAVVQVVISLVQFLTEMAPVLIDGALQILVALATGIGQALPTLIPAIVQMLLSIVDVILQNLPTLIQAGIQILIGLIQGIMAALPVLIQQLPVILTTIVQVIIANLPILLEASIKIIFALIDGIIQAIPSLVAVIPQLISGITNALISSFPQLMQMGVNLVIQIGSGISQSVSKLFTIGQQLMNGFWTGLKSKFAEIWQSVKDFCAGIINTIQNALGIHSDSRIANQFAHNFAGGWITGLSQMRDPINDAMLGFGNNIVGTLPGNTGGVSQMVNNQANQSRTTNVTINNPIGQTSDQGIRRGMQQLAWLGVEG